MTENQTEIAQSHWERKFREAQAEIARVKQVANELDDMRKAAEAAYREVLQWWHEADPDHCGGECFREESISAHLSLSPGSTASQDPS